MNKPSLQVGDVFPTKTSGTITVIKYTNNANVTIRHNDKFGHVAVISVSQIKSGNVRNPYEPNVYGHGFVGSGRFKPSIDGKQTKCAVKWRGVLRRCFDKTRQTEFPTYKDCTVSDEWLNFQNFAEWYYSNAHADTEYFIDKDLLCRGNKHYSAENCALVPHKINTLILDSGAIRGEYPVGVSKIPNSTRFKAALKKENKCHYLGSFENARAAHQAYALAKEAHIKTVANEWRGLIDERVYDALIAWAVSLPNQLGE